MDKTNVNTIINGKGVVIPWWTFMNLTDSELIEQARVTMKNEGIKYNEYDLYHIYLKLHQEKYNEVFISETCQNDNDIWLMKSKGEYKKFHRLLKRKDGILLNDYPEGLIAKGCYIRKYAEDDIEINFMDVHPKDKYIEFTTIFEEDLNKIIEKLNEVKNEECRNI